MPMIDVYSAEGTFADKHALARDLASGRHALGEGSRNCRCSGRTPRLCPRPPGRLKLSNVDGDGDYVHVQVLTPGGRVGPRQEFGVVRELTDIVCRRRGKPGLTERTWCSLHRVARRRMGDKRACQQGADIAEAARSQLAALAGKRDVDQ